MQLACPPSLHIAPEKPAGADRLVLAAFGTACLAYKHVQLYNYTQPPPPPSPTQASSIPLTLGRVLHVQPRVDGPCGSGLHQVRAGLGCAQGMHDDCMSLF